MSGANKAGVDAAAQAMYGAAALLAVLKLGLNCSVTFTLYVRAETARLLGSMLQSDPVLLRAAPVDCWADPVRTIQLLCVAPALPLQANWLFGVVKIFAICVHRSSDRLAAMPATLKGASVLMGTGCSLPSCWPADVQSSLAGYELLACT